MMIHRLVPRFALPLFNRAVVGAPRRLAAKPAHKPEAVKAGTIPDRLRESSYWHTTVSRLLKLTNASSYAALQENLQVVADERHPEGHLPIYYFKNGVHCAGHPGNAQYVFKLRWPHGRDGKPIEFYLGLECAANLRFIPAKFANSKDLREATKALQEQEDLVAELHLQRDQRVKDPSLSGRLREAETELSVRRERMREIWLRENRREVLAYNEVAYRREGPVLREKLFSVEMRAAKLAARGDRDDSLAVVRKLAKDLRDLHSYAEGVRRERVFLLRPLVERFNEIFELIKAQSPALIAWPSFDISMRTFERYVEMEGDRVRATDIFDESDLKLIRDSLAIWRRGVEEGGGDEISETNITRLRDCYDRLLRAGFITRHALLSQHPRLESQLRMVKEDLALLPEGMRESAEFLSDFLDAFGSREVTTQRVVPEKPSHATGPREETRTGGHPAAVTESQAPFMRSPRRVHGKGEKVGRFPEDDVRRFEQLAKWLGENYRTREEISTEFPDIDRWIGELAEHGPTLAEGKAPPSIARLLASGDEARAVARRMEQWQDLKDGELFPRHAALKFQEIAQRRKTRGVRKAQVPGFESMVTRLQLSKKGRTAWRTHMKEKLRTMPEAVRSAWRAAFPAMDSGKDTFTLEQIENLSAFDAALAANFTRVDSMTPRQQAILELQFDFAEPHSLIAHRLDERFLWERGYITPETAQIIVRNEGSFVDAASTAAPGALSLAERVGRVTEEWHRGQLELSYSDAQRISRAAARLHQGKIIGRGEQILLERVADGDRLVVLEGLAVEAPMSARFHEMSQKILASTSVTDAMRAAYFERVKTNLRAKDFSKATPEVIAREVIPAVTMIAALHASAKDRRIRDSLLLDQSWDALLAAATPGITFGWDADPSPEARLHRVKILEEMARVSPQRPTTEKNTAQKSVAYRFLYALADVPGARDSRQRPIHGQFNFAIRDAAIEAMRRLLAEDRKTWEPIFTAALRYGLNPSAKHQPDERLRKRMAISAREALSKLGLKAV